MAESTLPAIDDETRGMLESQVKKGKSRKFILICKGVDIKTLIVFKKGPYGIKVTAAKKAGFKGEVYTGIVTGQGVNLTFQLPASDAVMLAMKAEGGKICADEKEPCKIAKLRQFLQEEAEYKSRPEFQFVKSVDGIASVSEDDEEVSPLESGLTKERLIEGLKKTKPFVEKALAVAPDRKSELMSAMASVKTLIEEGKFEEAQTAMLELGGLLRKIMKAAPPQPDGVAPVDPMAGPSTEKQTKKSDWDALLKELTPKLRAFVQYKIGDYKKLGDLLKQAQDAKPTDLDKALELLAQCRTAVNEIEVKHKRDYEKVRDENAGRFANAEKLESIKDDIKSGRTDAQKLADELNFGGAVGRLRELIDLIHRERDVIEKEFNKVYDDALYAEIEYERDPNTVRDVFQKHLTSWDLVAAAAELKQFKTELERARRVGFYNLGETESRSAQAKLQNAQQARNTAMAVIAAKRLIDDKGNLRMDADLLSELAFTPAHDLAGVIAEIEHSGLDDLPQTVHALEILKRLQTDEDLRNSLSNVKKPTDANSTASKIIRATLGLKKDEAITDAHARQAALSALLFQARQGEVGSCFATATAVQIQRNNPERFLADMQEMFSTGKLTRTIQHNGSDYTVESPFNTEMLVSPLDKKTTVPRQGGSLHLAPDVAASLDFLGIKPGNREQVIKDAAQDARVKAAIDAAMPELTRNLAPEDKLKLISSEVLKLVRANRSLSIKNALSQAITNLGVTAKGTSSEWAAKQMGHLSADAYAVSQGYTDFADFKANSGKNIPDEYAKTLGLANDAARRKDACLKKCEPFDRADGNDAFSPQQLLDAVVEVNIAADKQAAAKKGASDAFLGQQDNRLMRAWEYTVATLVEKDPAVESNADRMNKGAGLAAQDKLKALANKYISDKGIADPNVQAAVRQIAQDVTNAFYDKLCKNVKAQYDPSAKTAKQSVAKDGHSSSGGYCLYHGDKRIDSEAAFGETLESLINDAVTAVTSGAAWNDAGKNLARQFGAEMINHAKTKGFRDECIAKNPTSDKDKLATPWTHTGGGDTDTLLQYYHDQRTPMSKVSTKTFGKPVDNAESLGEFLVDTLKGMKLGDKLAIGKAENAAIPVRAVGNHAFTLKPGDPTLHTILNGEKSGAEVMAEFKSLEGKKNEKRRGNQPLNNPPDGVVAKIIQKACNIFGDKKDDAIARINTRLTALNVKEISMADLRTHLRQEIDQILIDFFSIADQAKRDPWVDKTDGVMASTLLTDVIPKDEFEPLIDAALEKLKVTDEKREPAKQAILKELKGDTETRDELDKLVIKVLKEAGVSSGDEQIKSALNQRRGIVIADTNWGDGRHMVQFSLVANPMTDAVEMWQINEDGTNPSAVNQNDWIKNSEWRVFDNTKAIGGAMGDDAWETRRGELREKLKKCVADRRGNISMMQAIMEIADQRYADGDEAGGKKALDRLETLIKRADKIASNVEAAVKALGDLKSAVEKVAIDEAKEAAKFIDSLVREVKVLRDENGINEFATRRKGDLELLKEGKQHLGVDVDLNTILLKA